MSVEFNETSPTNFNYKPQRGAVTSLFIKLGLAKDEAGAKKVMMIVAIICFALSIYFFLKV